VSDPARWWSDEEVRREAFPVVRDKIFLAHAAVTALPSCASAAITRFATEGSLQQQEAPGLWKMVEQCRRSAARLIGADPSEIALLGPTALGLNLVALGLDWQPGDEVIGYFEDYPANVYPWLRLRDRGVVVKHLHPAAPGALDWPLIEASLTPRTRLVALASAHFVSGYRIDLETIGRELRARGILFCLDGIQTLGAFPVRAEWIDFLSADAHKWMLGPVGAGIFYVKKELFDRCRPALVGSWNVVSPDFIAQDRFEYYDGARRYEPGTLNLPGIAGMLASLELIQEVGIKTISKRILSLRAFIVEEAGRKGYRPFPGPEAGRPDHAAGILSLIHPDRSMPEVFRHLAAKNIVVSQRKTRAGTEVIRVAPHFYNTEKELETFFEALP
jgi:selenocysteine lyase/cysteine desulfurase